MPVRATTLNGRPAFAYGASGKKYPYTPGDAASLKRAKRRAIQQGLAIAHRQGVPFEGEKYNENHDPENGQFTSGPGGEAATIIDRAVAKFGVTEDYRNAGYILPDGRMLNLQRDMGTRGIEHADAARYAMTGKMAPAQGPNVTDNEVMQTFAEKTGAIRFQGRWYAEVYGDPTPAQVRTLSSAVGSSLDEGAPKFLLEQRLSDPAHPREAWVTKPEQVEAFFAGKKPSEVQSYRALDEALAILSGAKFNPNHDPETGQFTEGPGDAAAALLNRDKMRAWMEEKTNDAALYPPDSIMGAMTHTPEGMNANVPFEHASWVARDALKQEIVTTLADRPGLANEMSDQLPDRLTKTYDPTLPAGGITPPADVHEATTSMRQQGEPVNGKFADQQGPTSLTAADLADPRLPRDTSPEGQRIAYTGDQADRMTPAEIKTWNARVFADANMDAWHGTSSDNDVRSRALQQAALDEFGLEKTDAGWNGPVEVEGASPEHLAASRAAFAEQQARLSAAHPPEQFRAYIREQYDSTQEALAAAGIKGEVTVYRGMQWRTLKEVPEELRPLMRTQTVATESPADMRAPSMEVMTQSNPLSSWSLSWNTALDFATGGPSGGYHVVLTAQVPVESIVSTARTGMGALTEGEVIVKGGELAATATKTDASGGIP